MANKNKENNNNTQQSPWIGIVFMVLFLVIVILIIIFGERSTYYRPGPFCQELKEDLCLESIYFKEVKDFFDAIKCQYKIKKLVI